MENFRHELWQEISTLSLAKACIWLIMGVLGLIVPEGWSWLKDQWKEWNTKPFTSFESTATSCKSVKDLVGYSREWVELRTAGGHKSDPEWSALTEHAMLCADYSSAGAPDKARRPHEVLEEIARTFGECFSYESIPTAQPGFFVRRDGLSLCRTPFVIDVRTNDYALVTPQSAHKALVLCMGRQHLRAVRAAKTIEQCSADALRQAVFPEALISDWLAAQQRPNR